MTQTRHVAKVCPATSSVIDHSFDCCSFTEPGCGWLKPIVVYG